MLDSALMPWVKYLLLIQFHLKVTSLLWVWGTRLQLTQNLMTALVHVSTKKDSVCTFKYSEVSITGKLTSKFCHELHWSMYLLNSLNTISTVEARFNKPLFNEVLDITNDTLRPGKNYSKMYGIEPRYNETRYNEHNPEAET